MDPAVTDFLAQAAATLVGAFVAFQLEALRRGKEEKREQVGRMKMALFTLVEQRNFLINLTNQYLNPQRTNPDRAITLIQFSAIPGKLGFDPAGLTFLFDKEAALMNDLAAVDLKFKTVTSALEIRNGVHSRLQDSLGAFQQRVSNTETAPLMVLAEMAAGRQVIVQLRMLTDHLYALSDDALAANRTVCEKVDVAFQRLFPKEKLFRISEQKTVADDHQIDDFELYLKRFDPIRGIEGFVIENPKDYESRIQSSLLPLWPTEVLIEWFHRHAGGIDMLRFPEIRIVQVSERNLAGRKSPRTRGHACSLQWILLRHRRASPKPK